MVMLLSIYKEQLLNGSEECSDRVFSALTYLTLNHRVRVLKGLLHGHNVTIKMQCYFCYNQRALKVMVSSELCTNLLPLKFKHR